MKRKVEPTGGTAAAEDEGSQVLWVVGQEQEEEEHASNFLSALPDLALGAVLDCLQQQESGAPTLRRDDDSKRSRSLPELYRLETLHKEFLNYQEGLWYEEDSDESSSDEWMDELAGRHRPPAHFPFEELMENDAPGRWASPSLLALRLTCRSVKWAVEAVARRGLFPQFELFTSVDRWLTSRIELPTVLVAASPEEAHHRHSIRELESAAIACANAHMHQLRLDAYLDLLLGATSEKRASLAQTLNCELSSGAEGADDGRARLRVEYTSHAGDFLGCEAGMGVESCLSLSLPGQPREVLRILCSATGRGLGREELLLEVFLDLHTTSLAWSQALDLGLGEQQPAPGPISTTRSTPSNGGVTKPLLTWQEVRQFPTMNSNDKLLGKIWRALGFTTVTRRRLARRRVERDRKEKAAGIGWDCADVEKVLLAGLGYAWPFQANGARVMGRQPYVTKWLRQAECFLQRKALLDEVTGFFTDHVNPVLTTQLEQLPQKLRGLRHVRRAIGQFFGQRRIALVGPALESLRKTRAGTTPDPVQSGRQAAESSPTFLGALRFVEGRSISVELMGDQQHPFTSSSVRWAVRLPGTTTAAAGGGHNDQPRNEKRRRVGPHLDKTSSLAQTNSDSNSDNNNDEMRGGAGGRLVFAYDHKLSVRSGAPNTWHERLAVRAVVPDHQQLEGYGAGEEHELYVSQRIYDVDRRDDMSYDMLADIGRLLGLRPTVATTTTTTASSLSSQEEEDEEERFGEEVANLLVMVAKVAMWGAHITLPPPCAVNQELADHLDCIAEADHHHLTVADSPPPLPAVPSPAAAADIAEVAAAPPSSAARVTASVQFVEAYLREPWPVGDESGLG